MDGRIIFGQWMKNLRIGFYQNLLLFFFGGGGEFNRKVLTQNVFLQIGQVSSQVQLKALNVVTIGNWLIAKDSTLLSWMISFLIWIRANKKRTLMKILRTCQLYNNGRFSPIWWQLSASEIRNKSSVWRFSREINSANEANKQQRQDFFSNCTSFLFFYVM